MAGRPDWRAWAGLSRGGLALLTALALAGCEEGATATGTAPSAGTGPALGPTDVTAPDVFHVAGPGLWDGRPSLGGIWVAHPDVQDPERVRIVNTTNGQEVIGALFRRERDLPGPALQVSSDAAAALGMLAGAPAALDVTALRRQEAPAPQPAPPAEPAAAPAPGTATSEAPAAEAMPAVPADVATTAPATPAASPARGGGLFGDLFGRPAAAPAEAIATTPLDAPTAVSAGASALRFPFVQLATLSTEAAANQAAQALAAKGLPARVVAVSGQPSWRLLLGPAATEAQQAELRDRARAEGYADAYLVRS